MLSATIAQCFFIQKAVMLRVYDFFDDSIVVLSSRDFEFDAILLSAIDEVWDKEQERRGKKLFNGKILSAIEHSNKEIKTVIVDYKHYLAKKTNPELFQLLNIIPVAVSGLLECKDGFVFGKRSDNVTQDAGNWELVPSGGIDCANVKLGFPVDFKNQLLVELKEEVGIDKNSIKSINTFCYILDESSLVLDIGISLYCDLDANSIESSYSKLPVKEYDQLSFIKRDDLSSFFMENSKHFVEVSRMLLTRYLGKTIF